MSLGNKIPWRSLENRRSAAFLVAGFLFLVNTVHEGVGRYTAVLGEPTFLNAVVYLSALVLSLVGLLGLYPRLADRVPRLARFAAAVVAVAGGSLVVLLLWASTMAALDRPLPPGILLMLTLVAVVIGFVLSGLACLRARAPTRLVGPLLLLFVAAWAVGLGLSMGVYGGDAPDWVAVSLNGASAVILLGIGRNLRTRAISSDQAKAPRDSTAP